MTFQARILSACKQILSNKADFSAEMFNGTLFVEGITPELAAKLETALIEIAGGVIVSPQGNTSDYAYDFI